MKGELLSILALYNYDPSIFDGLTLPDVSELPEDGPFISDPEPLNKALLIDNILAELAEVSLVYTDPETVKRMIQIWSGINHNNWLELWKTLLYSYNPIWNKDGSYTETRSESGSGSGGGSVTYGKTMSHDVTGYDSNAYSPDTKDTAGGVDSNTSSATYSNSESVSRTESGNIGVTTTQAMIREQREVVEFNLYQYITESFKSRFCVMVY